MLYITCISLICARCVKRLTHLQCSVVGHIVSHYTALAANIPRCITCLVRTQSLHLKTKDRNSSIKGRIILLNTPTASMPIYAYPQTVSLGFILGRRWWLRHSATWRIAANYAPSAMLFSGEEIPPKLPRTMGDPDPHVIHGYVGPPHPTCQMPCRLSQPSLQGSRWIIPILYYWIVKLPFPWGDPDLHLIHGY